MNASSLALAKLWAADVPGVTAVYEGFKYVKGRRTKERCIVFAVEQKRPLADVPPSQRVPDVFSDARTDVIQAAYSALSLVARKRPCPAGFSIGHVRITAGTFGLPVRRGTTGEWFILTNNHVAANSNDARPGDRILQPGKADGGADSADWWANLVDFVSINFDGAQPPKKNRLLGAAWWAAVKGVGDAGAWVANCPYRVHVRAQAIPQPSPNLVDAAVCKPVDQAQLDPQIHGLGVPVGVRDLVLGDRVVKVGRTTEQTHGLVEGVNGQVRVQYGTGKLALFEDQVIIRGATGGEFSAGGDSGSAILTEDGYVGGLLFAGGGGQTIANKISHVAALLGVRL